MAAVKPPGFLAAPVVSWRAKRIADPVERLRYLQAAGRWSARRFVPVSVWRGVTLTALVPVLLWAWFLVPAPVPSSVRSTLPVSAPQHVETRTAVWVVEDQPGFEVYSNGLRVEKEFTTHNHPRTDYAVYRNGEGPVATRHEPVGIVFHATESHQAPFEPSETRHLKRIGHYLLEYVRQMQAYHYVIDRFGRVYRVVVETDSANHAGPSVWSNGQDEYISLNRSFLGVAVEAQTETNPSMNTAQVHSLRVLTEMLRARYDIPAANCVTHAQVSVNPSNWQIGYHVDWAIGFPFAEVGLPDNYRLKLAAVSTFGFSYDSSFLSAGGDRRWAGLIASLDDVNEQAGLAGISAMDYRKRLQRRFVRISNSATRERGDEQ